VGSCERHQIDPFAYLKDILERLPAHPADRLGELRPDAWLETRPQARRESLRNGRGPQDASGIFHARLISNAHVILRPARCTGGQRIPRVAMFLNAEWSERFLQACSTVRSARRRSLPAGQLVYSTIPGGRCWAVVAGYIKLLDPRVDGNRFIRLILGRCGLFGECPFGAGAFRGFISPQPEAGRRPRPRGSHRNGPPGVRGELARPDVEAVRW
jgi:hypothetical protein